MKAVIRQIQFGSEEYRSEVALRTEVLRKPLGLSFSEVELAAEKDAVHFAAFEGSEIVGCLILVPLSAAEVRMRQVAVIPAKQGSGIGRLLIEAAENYARFAGFEWMYLNARDSAVQFYLACGYRTVGEPFTEVTIPHRKMQKRLSETP
ncbi:MAG: GNAT family N-acetyltransferase [Bdellovibrionales bacterium]|nr:GNAT family N-acetyltransferase [Bdellovibrionales bacterium]